MVFKKNKKQHILAIIVGSAAAVPLVCLPVGIRSGLSPALAVKQAYASIFGMDELEEGDVIEDWALVSKEEDMISAENVVVEGDHEAEEMSADYSDIQKYTVFQVYDEADLPVELLDPQFFAPDDTQYYIKARNSILKETPIMDSTTLTTLRYGQGVKRIGIGDTWSKVRTDDGKEGFVLTNSITDEMVWTEVDDTVWVDTSSLIVRKEPSTGADMLTVVNDEERLSVIGVSDKWYKVTTKGGVTGYVYISYTTHNPPPTPTPTPTPIVRSTSNGGGRRSGGSGSSNIRNGRTFTITGRNGESIVNIAASMLGVRYVFGGASSRGIDCSGLTLYCYKQLGISLPHSANAQCNGYGVRVDRNNVRLGDIICYEYGGYCGHVAIYAGGGKVIHASRSRGRVCYGNMNMMSIRAIKRILN
ncbi:MAG: C40 family peptidase [Clostridiales bacterium]|nr:C40 family peptidase [Clostridiales bacterium]